ncbi:MAG: hypothetical protein H6741_30110 [Alphaproteobacteria bacterium]|nr:hypothetical protein [Alphaproteobacteria bacterium]
MPAPRFLFLVHPLTPFVRRWVGLRRGDWEMMRGGEGQDAPGRIARVGLWGRVEGEVVSIPWLPERLLEDQEGAVQQMRRAIEERPQRPDAVGLGSLLALVGGRGVALSEAVDVPVTTGAAATSWAAVHNTLRVLDALGEHRVAVLGFSGTVGQAVAERLQEEGVEVLAGGRGKALERRAERMGLPILPEEEAAGAVRVVVGAATTGGTLDPAALRPGAVLLDVALPPTLKAGPLPEGVRVLAGEAVEMHYALRRGFWGRPYQVLAGYGPRQLYACLIEPMVMAMEGRTEPYALGRRLSAEGVRAFAEAARRQGLRPRLAEGWWKARL